ncbi:MAG: pyridine nucleotide-disulfide oxidoreductase [Ignavibacteria bacterium GWB2_35_12]|nr:MAG: pyridine nucleotide-disulfide oxidoreductase [Ignavibacteria bacterium GWB2_35_12]OGU91314.1 MAG: pyridine nucleotide-disulfide oxidoreductase [Ignavibacteria bacterium RIFOXYA2_FULL_35_10]OGV21747.1 MAG: pyridine nucleotide-disulfide oxidoreductase [Ignavibacteria bacterium RIFOXYC2_FULL_35_21]
MQLSKPRVIIIGGGFGGLTAAKSLKNDNVDIILIDKTNHHLFQPLLYQVATAALSPGDIAIPLRSILRRQKNVQVIMDEALRIDINLRTIYFRDGELQYDYLILAPGALHSYYGHQNWEKYAPGIKSLKDALSIREQVLKSFEYAERLYGTPGAKKYLNFVIIGGGPTGIELAGAVAEIARKTMLPDFPILKYDDIQVFLIESSERLLPSFPPGLSDYTYKTLIKLGVQILTKTRVTDIDNDYVYLTSGKIETRNAIWAAGNEASPLLQSLGLPLDKSGRVIVNNNLSIPGIDNVFVIGDSAHFEDKNGNILPSLAPVAMQEARFVAKMIENRKYQNTIKPFQYKDRGSLATIGKAKAIALFGKIKFSGFLAWLIWSFLHILFIINFRNRFRVMFEWLWYYITNQPGARLIVYNKNDKDELS